MAEIPKLDESDIKNVANSNLPENTKKKVLALMNLYYVDTTKVRYVLYLAPGTTGIEHLVIQVVKNANLQDTNFVIRDVKNIDTVSENGLTLVYAFNHTAGRFQNSLGMDKFLPIVRKAKWSSVIILEFGVGDKDSAKNNPPEITSFEYEKGGKARVVKFWYDIDFNMSAKTENDESTRILCKQFYPHNNQICAHIKFAGSAERYTLKTSDTAGLRIFDEKMGTFFCGHAFRDADDYKARDRASSSTCVCPECE